MTRWGPRWAEDEFERTMARRLEEQERARTGSDRRKPALGTQLAARHSVVLRAILRALVLHPKVAWAVQMNAGAFKVDDDRYVKCGFKGMSDITGQLVDGRRLEVEVKTPNDDLTAEQERFLQVVRANNGVGFMARSVDDIVRHLGDFKR